MNVPIYASPGRGGFGPQLSLTYDSGAGNGPFGLGWGLSLPTITRKTDKGLPRYRDGQESDVFVLSGAEDLVAVIGIDGKVVDTSRGGYHVRSYRPRIEGLFARIERWTRTLDGDTHWRSISRENITTLYGKAAESRIADPADSQRIFSWLICESYDDKGNAIAYRYAPEDSEGVDRFASHERNRTSATRSVARYLKRIQYGNRASCLLEPDLARARWLFELVFDYDEAHCEALPALPGQHAFVRASSLPAQSWSARPDAFSSYRAGFEVRSYRRCRQILMFHNFDELGSEPILVRSTDFDYADLDYAVSPSVATELAHRGSTRFASFMRSATQRAYVQDPAQPALIRNGVKYVTYLSKALPPVELDYSQASIDECVRDVERDSLENLPAGLDGTTYQWVDLDGEGLSGILSEQGGAWFYKRNISVALAPTGTEGAPPVARFLPMERLGALPSPARLAAGQQLLDLAGNGQLDLVQFDGAAPGYFERTTALDWSSLQAFEVLPLRDPLKFFEKS